MMIMRMISWKRILANSCIKVSNVNQAGKAEGEGIVVYPDKVTLLAAWFEDGKMVSK